MNSAVRGKSARDLVDHVHHLGRAATDEHRHARLAEPALTVGSRRSWTSARASASLVPYQVMT